MDKVNLGAFSTGNFDKGAGELKIITWYFINALLVRASWNPFMNIKIILLRAFGAKIGRGLVIKNNVTIKFPWKLTIGNNVWLGEQCWIDNLDYVTIGSNVCISQGALLLTGNHDYTNSSMPYRNAPITLEDGVWDKKRSYLYATATKKEGVTALFRFKYDGNRSNPKLINQTTLYTFSNESGGHDLFPVYGEEDKLWLTAASAVYKFDLTGVTDATTNDSTEPTCEKVYSIADIKSICNGPDGILMLKPTEEWWAEGLVNEKGEELFKMDGAKIYKGRWMIDNLFSYPEKHDFVLSED